MYQPKIQTPDDSFFLDLQQRLKICRLAANPNSDNISRHIPELSPLKIAKLEHGNRIKNLPLYVFYKYAQSLGCDVEIKLTQHLIR